MPAGGTSAWVSLRLVDRQKKPNPQEQEWSLSLQGALKVRGGGRTQVGDVVRKEGAELFPVEGLRVNCS